MGNCCSSTGSAETSKNVPVTHYKRTGTANVKKTKEGRQLDAGNVEKSEDARKAAGEAAQKRLLDQRAKNGKLGEKLEKQRKESTQGNINEKLTLPLVYD